MKADFSPDFISVLSDDLLSRLATSLKLTVAEPELWVHGPAIIDRDMSCPINRSIPEGVLVWRAQDCQCSPGYAFASGSCIKCEKGKFKTVVGNELCDACLLPRTTSAEGAASSDQCQCPPGQYEIVSECLDCEAGWYCVGDGKATPCPPNFDSGAGAVNSDFCECAAGFYLEVLNKTCEPCASGFLKDEKGNGTCSQQCPANAISFEGSKGLDDCFCKDNFYAVLDTRTRNLSSCASCSNYNKGLKCSGGFLQGRKDLGHIQPTARKGFFQTGRTIAVECDAKTKDDQNACLGGKCFNDNSSSACNLDLKILISKIYREISDNDWHNFLKFLDYLTGICAPRYWGQLQGQQCVCGWHSRPGSYTMTSPVLPSRTCRIGRRVNLFHALNRLPGLPLINKWLLQPRIVNAKLTKD